MQLKLFFKALNRTITHDGIEHAGYMAFMVLLSLFPFIIFIVAFTGFLGISFLGENFVTILVEALPETAIKSFLPRINEIVKSPPSGLLTMVTISTIWTSSSFVEALRTILNRVYQVETLPAYWFRRLLSIVQFLFITGAITVIMLVLILVPIIINRIPELDFIIKNLGVYYSYGRYLIMAGSLIITAAWLYYMIPNVKLKFKNVLPGAFIATILWLALGYVVANYITYYNQINIVYGSLGSIVITLLFFYAGNIIFIYGAEFNHLYQENKILCY